MSLLIFLATSLIGGTGAPLIKFTLNYFPTISFVASRALLSSLILLPFIYHELAKIKPKQAKYLILSSVFFAGNWLFFAMGIQRTSVIMGQLIYLPTAPVVAIIAYLALREKLTKEQLLGLTTTIIGLAILTYGSIKSQDVLSFGTPIGNFLIVCGLLSWSLYTVTSRKISAIYKPQVIIFFNFIITTLITLLLFPFNLANEITEISKISAVAVLGLAGVVILSSILFSFLYQWLIKNTSAFISSLTLYPISLIAGLAGVVFFNEKLTPSFVSGAILVMIGVFIATTYQYFKNTVFKYAN